MTSFVGYSMPFPSPVHVLYAGWTQNARTVPLRRRFGRRAFPSGSPFNAHATVPCMPRRMFVVAFLASVLAVLRIKKLRAYRAMEAENRHSSTRQGRRRSDLRVQILNAFKMKEAYDLQELGRACSLYTWNQVLLEVHRLSRKGELRLVSRRRGLYTVTLPIQQTSKLAC